MMKIKQVFSTSVQKKGCNEPEGCVNMYRRVNLNNETLNKLLLSFCLNYRYSYLSKFRNQSLDKPNSPMLISYRPGIFVLNTHAFSEDFCAIPAKD